MKCTPTLSKSSLAKTESHPSPKAKFRPAWCKRIVLNQLKNLQGGVVEIVDHEGTCVVGDEQHDAIRVSIEVHDFSFYRDIILGGNLGVAEAYLQRKWTCDDLPGLIRIFCRNMSETSAMNRGVAWFSRMIATISHRFSRNSMTGSKRNIAAHYDLSNEFFQIFLDPTMMYSSAYFTHPEMSLEQASIAKLDRICRKLELKESDHLVEIGTGWGGLAIYAAQNYGCRVTTTTISEQQFALAQERVRAAGLKEQITLLFEDYRNLIGQYDKLVSIEMIEAVGHEYLGAYMTQCHDLLKPGGKLLIQGITIPDQRYEVYRKSVDFIQKYIFPGGHLPSIGAIHEAASRNSHLRLVNIEDFGHSYALTLREWRRRFFDRIDDVRELGFDERFINMWDYYFSYCEGAFLERAVGVSQIVYDRATY